MPLFELCSVLRDLEDRVVRARVITARLDEITKPDTLMFVHDELRVEFLPEHVEEAKELFAELENLATLPVESAKPIVFLPITAEIEDFSKPWGES